MENFIIFLILPWAAVDHLTEIQGCNKPCARIPSIVTSFKQPSLKEKTLLDFEYTAKHLGWNLSAENKHGMPRMQHLWVSYCLGGQYGLRRQDSTVPRFTVCLSGVAGYRAAGGSCRPVVIERFGALKSHRFGFYS